MSKPLFFGGSSLHFKRQIKKIKNNKVLFFAALILLVGLSARILNTEPVFYAHASINDESVVKSLNSSITEDSTIFKKQSLEQSFSFGQTVERKSYSESDHSTYLSRRIYEMVGDAPIREMVPFISMRDEKVAAFLVGIAKKESSFGLASPSKNGETCYNYWGYKGMGERGSGMGYACFASAEEAIRVVGDRIEVLVNKDRNTPARMVNTWKCGVSCQGDPGAQGWISTVAFYFEKIVG